MIWRRKSTYGKRNAADLEIKGKKQIGAEKLPMELSSKTSNAEKKMILNTRGWKGEAVKTEEVEKIGENKVGV